MKKLDCPPNGVKFAGKLHPEGAQLSLLSAALHYAQQGWPVLPLHSATHGICSCQKGKLCANPGKHPRTQHGVKDASCDPKTIRAWWKKYPEANIGLAMGKDSGLIALDVDGEEGRASLFALEKQHGALPPTLRAETGGNGEHIYFRAQGAKIPNRVRFAPGLDTRSEGGYVVAPPSLHASGASYSWLSSPTAEPASLPQWLLTLLTTPKPSPAPKQKSQSTQTTRTESTHKEPKGYWQKALEGEAQAVASAKEGERTNRLRDAALKLGSLLARGEPGDPQEGDLPEITKTLLDAAHRNGSTQKYDQAELLRTIERGLQKGRTSPREKRPTHNGQRKATFKPKTTQEPKTDPQDTEEVPPIVAELNQKHAVVFLGSSVRILRESFDPELKRPRLDFLAQKDFELFYKSRKVQVGQKEVPAGAYWIGHPKRRNYEQVVFAPDLSDSRYYNLWKGFTVSPKPGDWSLFRSHLKENICRGNEAHFNYLLALLADGVQHPALRPGISIVLRGGEGTGKSVVAKHYGYLFGPHCRTVSQTRHLVGNFNAHLADCLFLVAEEAFWAGDKQAANALKDLITGDTLLLERKGKDAITIANRIRLLFVSNEQWVIPAGLDARRFFVLDVGEKRKRDRPYFAAMEEQMKQGGYEAMLYDLLHEDLSRLDLGAVPQTEALLEQKILSFSPLERFWYGCLDRGEVVPGRSWDELLPAEEVHQAYLQEALRLGDRHKSSDTQLGITLRKLCPELLRERRTVSVRKPDPELPGRTLLEQKRCWCYQLPSLERCRQLFAEVLSMPLTWG